jgi:NTP pyrophosphatase (non-canonical NTP hydrolase)
MSQREDSVAEFNRAMGHPVGVRFNPDDLQLSSQLVAEEAQELVDAVNEYLTNMWAGRINARTVMSDILKELADLQYVVSRFAVVFDLDLDEAFDRVHKSNMSKLGDDGNPIYRDDGKVMKGPNYKPPYLEDLI